ncbi:hypothetical protein PHET_07483 [Paragonimus heterotremus]|uniref:Integrase catalytic domain-containing protein n=1 Tax=Paragonimus heterotremus TaxID=100268 RepID=A0A8J4SMZ6_9TREM|nr:hypothetical protein PHET_07483 [Paragonimus heterotremus]
MMMWETCHILNIKKSRNIARHPGGYGLVEHTNRTLQNFLEAFLNLQNTRNLDTAPPRCLLAFRVTASTGHTPHFMASGREPRLASDTLLQLTTFSPH